MTTTNANWVRAVVARHLPLKWLRGSSALAVTLTLANGVMAATTCVVASMQTAAPKDTMIVSAGWPAMNRASARPRFSTSRAAAQRIKYAETPSGLYQVCKGRIAWVSQMQSDASRWSCSVFDTNPPQYRQFGPGGIQGFTNGGTLGHLFQLGLSKKFRSVPGAALRRHPRASSWV